MSIKKYIEWIWSWAGEDGRYVVPRDMVVEACGKKVYLPAGFLTDGSTCSPDGPHDELLAGAAAHDLMYETAQTFLPRQTGVEWYTDQEVLKSLPVCNEPVTKEEADIFYKDYIAKLTFKKLSRLYYWGLKLFGGKTWNKYRRMEVDGEQTFKRLDPKTWIFNGWERDKAQKRS